jgi:hypothetical protein
MVVVRGSSRCATGERQRRRDRRNRCDRRDRRQHADQHHAIGLEPLQW